MAIGCRALTQERNLIRASTAEDIYAISHLLYFDYVRH